MTIDASMTESHKYLPEKRSIKASEHSYTRKMFLAESKPPKPFGKKVTNLSAYQPRHLNLEMSPREKQAQANRIPFQKPAWERTLPAMTTKATKKPMTIEESLATGYRKRLDMTQFDSAVQSNDDLANAGVAPGNGGEGQGGEVLYAS